MGWKEGAQDRTEKSEKKSEKSWYAFLSRGDKSNPNYQTVRQQLATGLEVNRQCNK